MASPCDGVGACGDGVVQCSPDGLTATCSTNPDGLAPQVEEEICDGKDNDCDGEVDEAVELTPPGECHTNGVCAGTAESCDGEAGWVCHYPDGYQEGKETTCDGLNNDCDAQTDEDFDLAGDVNHCGACNQLCDYSNLHAESQCVNSGCFIGLCYQGWLDLDGEATNGCEEQFAQAKVIYVDPSNETGEENGTQQFPFSSFETAYGLSVAGDLIKLAPGDYEGPLILDKTGVTVSGPIGDELAKVSGNADEPVVTFAADGVVLATVALTGGTSGVMLDNVHKCRLSNCQIGGQVGLGGAYGIPGSDGIGIQIVGGGGNSVVGNTMTLIKGGTGGVHNGGISRDGGIGAGMFLHSTTSNIISGNTISDITGGTGGNGVTSFSAGGTGGIAAGVYLKGSTGNIFHANSASLLFGGKGGGPGFQGKTGSNGTGYGFYLKPDSLDNLLATSNLVGNDPVLYFFEKIGGTVTGFELTQDVNPTNLGKVVMVNCVDVEVADLVVGRFKAGLSQDVSYGTYGANGEMGTGIYLSGGGSNYIHSSEIFDIQGGVGGNCRGNYGGGSGGYGVGVYLSNTVGNKFAEVELHSLSGGQGGHCSLAHGPQGVKGTSAGFHISEDSLDNEISASNSMDGEPVLYFYQEEGAVVAGHSLLADANPTNLGKIAMIDCWGMTISGNVISGFVGASGGAGEPYPDGGAGGLGAGIFISGGGGTTVWNNQISSVAGGAGSTAEIGGLGGTGAGILVLGADGTALDENTITDISGGAGGAASLGGTGGKGGTGIGVFLNSDHGTVSTSNELSSIVGGAGGTSKKPQGGTGGTGVGFRLLATTDALVVGNSIANVTGGQGGSCTAQGYGGPGGTGTGMDFEDINDGTIAENSISKMQAGVGGKKGPYGGGGVDGATGTAFGFIVLPATLVPDLTGNSVASVTGQVESAGLHVTQGSSATLSNTIFSNITGGPCISNHPDNDPADVTLSYSIFHGCEGGAMVNGTETPDTCIHDQDPLFMDAEDGNLHLQPGSPAIDAGDPASDYANEPDPNGCRVNMGAYGNTEEATSAPGAQHCQ